MTHRLDSRAGIGLSPIPVYPSPPSNLFVQYESYPLRKRSFAFEGGAEARWELSNRFLLIYRFTGLLGTKDMSKMEGYYEPDNPSIKYPFEIRSKGSAIHNTFSLRYRLGRKPQKENWWESDTGRF
ncbi:hypothetical protein [Lunatimonas sp.]|uniref:hypothetical protein n=1 Tax=Lunatimonas sp. TaxID=2060141 RepID=UPI00263B1F5C|nr:hypothetical protein [Lunatimonas sp.]